MPTSNDILINSFLIVFGTEVKETFRLIWLGWMIQLKVGFMSSAKWNKKDFKFNNFSPISIAI